MPRRQDADDSFTNTFDATLSEVKQASPTLRNLLSKSGSDGYASEQEADRVTVAKLRYWRFSDEDICEILGQYRTRQRDSDALRELVHQTILTEVDPVQHSLGTALIESGKQNGGRPIAGVATLRDIQAAFEILGDEATSRRIAESGCPKGNATDIDSVKKRVERGLHILERAGYVSHKEVGQLYVWCNEGLSSLSLPTTTRIESRTL